MPDPIVVAGDPVLRAPARPVPASMLGTPGLRALVSRMLESLRAAPGVGIAAPQIGEPWRVIVVEDTEKRMARLTPAEREERGRVETGTRVVVNPVLTKIGDATAVFFEGCLSVPGYAALVERALEVEVAGADADGNPVAWRASGWPARILQHEVDHLDGVLYVDRMKTRSVVAREAEARFGGRQIAQIREELRC
ncbi:polypeptide deformylase [Hyaloraphidium curvatum]|nr:polypeptide deformylase [Hyaloraphidium curvatum]